MMVLQVSSNNEELLNGLNLIICIVAKYYDQSDLMATSWCTLKPQNVCLRCWLPHRLHVSERAWYEGGGHEKQTGLLLLSCDDLTSLSLRHWQTCGRYQELPPASIARSSWRRFPLKQFFFTPMVMALGRVGWQHTSVLLPALFV